MTYPTAFTVSLLAWGILQFPEGYATAKATLAAANTVRWGADYLLKTVAATENGTQIVYQVCPNLRPNHCFTRWALDSNYSVSLAAHVYSQRSTCHRPAGSSTCTVIVRTRGSVPIHIFSQLAVVTCQLLSRASCGACHRWGIILRTSCTGADPKTSR